MTPRRKSEGARERDRLYHYAKGVGGNGKKDKKDEPSQPPVQEPYDPYGGEKHRYYEDN